MQKPLKDVSTDNDDAADNMLVVVVCSCSKNNICVHLGQIVIYNDRWRRREVELGGASHVMFTHDWNFHLKV